MPLIHWENILTETYKTVIFGENNIYSVLAREYVFHQNPLMSDKIIILKNENGDKQQQLPWIKMQESIKLLYKCLANKNLNKKCGEQKNLTQI